MDRPLFIVSGLLSVSCGSGTPPSFDPTPVGAAGGQIAEDSGAPSFGGGGNPDGGPSLFEGGAVKEGGQTIGGCAEAAKARSYLGCDFWPTVVANNVWSIFDYAVVVANAQSQTVDVTVERGGAEAAKATVPPNGLQTIFLPWVPELKGPDTNSCGQAVPVVNSVRVPNGAYHLTSSLPVTVYQFNALEYAGLGGPPGKDWSSCPGNQPCVLVPGTPPVMNGCFSFSNDASLLLPTTALTGTYRIAGPTGWPLGNMGAYFAVTGTENGTTLTVIASGTAQINPGADIPATAPGGTFTLPLARGEVVQIMGTPTGDLSGSLVTADKPVQVIAGIPCLYAPFDKPACDHVEESVFPAETLGLHYFVVAHTGPFGAPPGHFVRLYGNFDGTTLTYPSGPPPIAPATINAGQVIDLGIVNTNFEIVGSQSFAVGTFMLGASIQDPAGRVGDPSESLTVAVEQYRTKYVFLAPLDYDVSFVDIVMPMGASVKVDGAAPAAPQPIGSGFGVSRQKLGKDKGGAHVLESDQPVGIQVMGFGSYTSYQYPGGSDLVAIAPRPIR